MMYDPTNDRCVEHREYPTDARVKEAIYAQRKHEHVLTLIPKGKESLSSKGISRVVKVVNGDKDISRHASSELKSMVSVGRIESPRSR